MKNIILFISIFTWISACNTHAQNLNTAKLDSLFAVLAENDKSMVSVAVSKNDQILYQKAIGFASLNDKVPANVHTKYRIGSITKTFTATMIFQLIETGKLSLTTTLSKFFPSVTNSDKITISNLLNHRSGIHNFTDDPAFLQYRTQPKTQIEMVEIIAKTKPDFEPNAKTAYSNSNYLLLGYIIEKITGKSYSENLNQRIVSKLNLKETFYGGKADLKKNESYSYQFKEEWIQQPETDLSIPGAAGAIVSTPTDLNKFITALFAGKLVSASNLNQMKAITDGMGMGLFQVSFNDKKLYGHNGSIDGFQSNLFYNPEDSLAVAICSNGTTYGLNSILIALLSAYYDVPFAIPSFKTIAVKPEELDQYAGVYSSTQIPLKITVSKKDSTLMAQATGQPEFPLTPTDKHVFKFDQAGIVMDFNPEKNEFILKQGGGNYLFKKN